MRREVGEAKMVACLAGDHFLVALDDVLSDEEGARFGLRLAEAVDAAALESELPAPHPSVGVAAGPDGSDSGALLRQAGAALHRADERPLIGP